MLTQWFMHCEKRGPGSLSLRLDIHYLGDLVVSSAVSKSNCTTLYDWLKISRHFFIQS